MRPGRTEIIVCTGLRTRGRETVLGGHRDLDLPRPPVEGLEPPSPLDVPPARAGRASSIRSPISKGGRPWPMQIRKSASLGTASATTDGLPNSAPPAFARSAGAARLCPGGPSAAPAPRRPTPPDGRATRVSARRANPDGTPAAPGSTSAGAPAGRPKRAAKPACACGAEPLRQRAAARPASPAWRRGARPTASDTARRRMPGSSTAASRWRPSAGPPALRAGNARRPAARRTPAPGAGKGFRLTAGPPASLAVSPDGRRIASSTPPGELPGCA